MFKDERGLTIIEVLMSVAILSIIMVPMMNSFIIGGRLNNDAEGYSTALTLAQSKIEELKGLNFSSIVDIPQTDFSGESDYSQYDGYSYSITVAASGLNTKTVTVTVFFYSDQISITAEIAKR